MPSHRAHRYLDLTLLGKSYYKLHRAIDAPYVYLGRGHRVLFHDYTAYAIAADLYPGDQNALWAAWCHLAMDDMCSRHPYIKENLEKMAKFHAKRLRGKRKRKRKSKKSKLQSG